MAKRKHADVNHLASLGWRNMASQMRVKIGNHAECYCSKRQYLKCAPLHYTPYLKKATETCEKPRAVSSVVPRAETVEWLALFTSNWPLLSPPYVSITPQFRGVEKQRDSVKKVTWIAFTIFLQSFAHPWTENVDAVLLQQEMAAWELSHLFWLLEHRRGPVGRHASCYSRTKSKCALQFAAQAYRVCKRVLCCFTYIDDTGVHYCLRAACKQKLKYPTFIPHITKCRRYKPSTGYPSQIRCASVLQRCYLVSQFERCNIYELNGNYPVLGHVNFHYILNKM